MYVNKANGLLAKLASQDERGVIFTVDGAEHCVPSHEFFTAYREATADEMPAPADPAADPAAAEKPAAKPSK